MEVTRETVIGPMGSEFHRISGLTPDGVLDRVQEMDSRGVGRRMFADAVRGTVSWMSPSSAHESLARAADDIIRQSGSILGWESKLMGGTRWRLPGWKSQTELEADAAFYIGENARVWIRAWKQGRGAIREFEERTPPDLVVEVEVTRFDQGKTRHYRYLGTRELWQVTRKNDDAPVSVAIIDLQVEDAPLQVTGSLVLPGLDDEILATALHLAEGLQKDELQLLLESQLATRMSGLETGGPDDGWTPPESLTGSPERTAVESAQWN